MRSINNSFLDSISLYSLMDLIHFNFINYHLDEWNLGTYRKFCLKRRRNSVSNGWIRIRYWVSVRLISIRKITLPKFLIVHKNIPTTVSVKLSPSTNQ
jgi:hypothetical protein